MLIRFKNAIINLIELYGQLNTKFLKPKDCRIKKVLAFCQDNIGDTLFTTPSIRALKHVDASLIIDVVADVNNAEIYQGNPNIRKLFIWDRKNNNLQRLRHLFSCTKEIRMEHYDTALFFELVPHYCNFQALISVLGGIRKRIGFNQFGKSKYLTDIVELDEGSYWAQAFGKLIETLGAEVDDLRMDLFFSPDDMDEINMFCAKNNIDDGNENKWITIHTGAGNYGVRKHWEDQKFIELARKLNEFGPFTFFFTGSSQDRQRIARLLKGENLQTFNLSGNFSIKGTALFLRKCKLLVTCDTLLLHLGLISRIPTVAIFGPTNPKLILPPVHETVEVAKVALPCSPCLLRNRKAIRWTCVNPNQEQCLNDLTVDYVFSLCKNYLSSESDVQAVLPDHAIET